MCHDLIYFPISCGKFVVINAKDSICIKKNRWTYVPSPSGYTGYAARWSTLQGKRRTIYMHRQILGVENTSRDVEVDHINGDGLCNTRCNLRTATSSLNKANKHHHNNPTGYRGVYRFRNKWKAQTKLNGKCIHLGVFDNPHDAARAFDAFARATWNDFAQVNFS